VTQGRTSGVKSIALETESVFGATMTMTILVAQVSHDTAYVATQSGVGLGCVIAVVCSWQRNRSILWAILAGILSWLYVIYFALTRRADERR
jgi:hypothetical protein